MANTIAENQASIDAVYEKFIAKPQCAKVAAKASQAKNYEASQSVNLADDELIAKAQTARNGNQFRRFMDGDWTGYPSQSEADQAFCNQLAFWTNKNPSQMDRIFRQSGL